MGGCYNAWIWSALTKSNYVVGIRLAVRGDRRTKPPNNQPSDSNNDHLSNAYARHPPLYHTGGCPNAWIWSAVAYSNFVVGIRLVLSGDSSPKPPNIQPSDSNNNHCSAKNTQHQPLYDRDGCCNNSFWLVVFSAPTPRPASEWLLLVPGSPTAKESAGMIPPLPFKGYKSTASVPTQHGLVPSCLGLVCSFLF